MAGEPTVTSFVRNDPAVSPPGTLSYTLTFSEPVTGVDASVFSLYSNTYAGSIASVTAAPGGAQYVVTVKSSSYDGMLRLDLTGTTKIHDLDGNSMRYGAFTQSIPSDPVRPLISLLADVTGDGKLDLIGTTTQYYYYYGFKPQSYVLIGSGNGNIYSYNDLPDTGYGYQAADINGDGRVDLVESPGYSPKIEVLIGNGTGKFTIGASYDFTSIVNVGGLSTYVSQINVGDFNKDGRPDVIASFTDTGSYILLNDGSGGFLPPSPIGGADKRQTIVTGDFDGDGKLDLALANTAGISLLFGNGDGTFRAPVVYGNPLPASQSSRTLLTGDMNGDGKPDLLLSQKDPVAYLNDGAGHFTAVNSPAVGTAIALADLDGDGKADLVHYDTSKYSGTLLTSLGAGDGTFMLSGSYNLPSSASGTYFNGMYYNNYYTYSLAVGDLTGDGHPDVIGTSYSSDVVLTNVPPPIAGPTYTIDKVPLVSSIAGSASAKSLLTLGQTDTITLTLGKAVTVAGGTPTLLLNSGGAATFDAAHSTSTVLAFTYAVHAGESSRALAVSGVSLNGATIADAAGTPADLSGAAVTFDRVQVDAAPQILFRNANDGRVASWHLADAAPIAKDVIDQVSIDWALDSIAHPAGYRGVEVFHNGDGRIAVAQLNGFQHALDARVIGQITSDWHYAGSGDLFHDGYLDILWRNDDGSLAIWQLSRDGTTGLSNKAIKGPSTDWHFAGIGDFAGDGRSEVLWQNADGRVVQWTFGGTIADPGPAGKLIDAPTADWHVAGIGDTNGDGRDDVLYLNNDGRIALHDTATNTNQLVDAVSADWSVVGLEDVNRDGREDIVFFNTSGDVAVWELQGANVLSKQIVDHVSSDWHPFV